MALEQLQAQIAVLLQGLEDKPEDAHELHDLIRQHLEQFKAMGMPLPADLVQLEERLEKDFAARGR
ncbi:MAG: hypothetical protein ACT4SY_03865 [Hyphomicrobiales bacterium]